MDTIKQYLSRESKGTLYAISSGLCYGLVGYFGITLIDEHLSISNMSFWRFLVSSLLAGLVVLWKRKSIPRAEFSEIVKIFLYGAAFYSTSSITYFMASGYIGSGLAMVIFFSYPAVVMLLNWACYRVKISKIYYAAVLVIITGMILLIDLHEITFDVFGAIISVLSAVFYACYMVASKKSNISPLLSTFIVLVGCSATCLIVACLDHSFLVPNELQQWFNILAISTICTVVPILLLLKGLEYITPEKAAMLSALEPILVVIFGIILLGEKITIMQVVGTVVVLAGAIIALFSSSEV